MNQLNKNDNNLVLKAVLNYLNHLLSGEKPAFKKRCQRAILKPLAVLFMWLSVSSTSVAASGAGVELVNNLLGTFGSVTDLMKSETNRLLDESGLRDAAIESQTVITQIAEGTVPVIGDLVDPFQSEAEKAMAQALSNAQLATDLLNKISADGAQKAIKFIADSPLFVDTDFGLTLPTGRLRVYKQGLEISICLTTVGPLGAVIINGISNAAQLCNINEPRMANPTQSLLAFNDLAVGHTHYRTNRILIPNLTSDLTQLPAPIEAETYVKINGQWIQIRLAGADPKDLEVEAKFEVGIKGGVSYYVEAEVEGEAAIKIKLKPIYAAEVIRSTAEVMFNKATSLGLDMDIGNIPSDTAAILKAGLQHLGDIEGQYEDEGGFGETSLDVKLTGGIGAGVWDTGIAGISAGGSLNLTYPLDALISLSAGTMERYLDIALGMNDANLRMATAILEGNAGAGLDAFKVEANKASAAFVEGVLDDLLEASTNIDLAASFKLSLLGDADKESIDIYESGIFLPIGDISTNLQANPNALGDAFAAAGYLMLASVDPDAVITDQTWNDLEQVVVPRITYTLKARSPVTGSLIGFENVGLLETIQTIAIIRQVLINVIKSGVEGSLVMLRTSIEDALNTADEVVIDMINEAVIPRSRELSANGALGAEVVAELGAGISIETEVKASLIMLLLGLPDYQEEHETELASAAIPVNFSLDAGASAGEGVELTVDAGGAMSFNLFKLTAKHWDGALPTPASVHVAGFPVLEFDGVINEDESFEGSGFLMLPMGGIVDATFSVDANGNVLSGSWNGGMDLGPLGKFTFIQGKLETDGIHGKINIDILGSPLKADFILASSGLLFGSYEGALVIAGQRFSSVSLDLGQNGHFSGTVWVDVLGNVTAFDLELLPDGQFSSQYQGVINLGGFDSNTNLALSNEGFTGSGTMNLLGSELVASNLIISSSGQVSGTFSGEIQAGTHTLSAVSLKTVNGGLIGTAMMDLPGAANVEVDLQIVNGKITATYSGEFMNSLSSQASMVITNTGINLTASLNTSMLTTATSQAIDLLLSVARAAEPFVQAARDAIPVLQTAFDVADEGLKLVQSKIDDLRLLYKQPLEVAKTLITGTQTLVTEAKNTVRFWNNKIKALDDWYNGLSKLARKVAWLAYKADRAALVISRNAANVILGGLNTTLSDAKIALAVLEAELDQQIKDLKAGLQAAYDFAKSELTTAVNFLNELLREISLLSMDAESIFSVQAMSFKAELGQLLPGSSFAVNVRLTFMGEQGQINLTFNPANPADSLKQLVTVLLAGTAQLSNSDITPPTVFEKTAVAQQAVADAEQEVQAALTALDNVDAQLANLIASYDSIIFPLELKINDFLFELNDLQNQIDALDPSNLFDIVKIAALQSLLDKAKALLDVATTELSGYQNELAGKIADLELDLQTAYDEASIKLADALNYLNSLSATPFNWHSGEALIQLIASDNVAVASITYSASGAQTIAETTVAGNIAFVVINVEGMTSLSFFATDTSGNVSAKTIISSNVDSSAPQIEVVMPVDNTVMPYDVTITAHDLAGSGISYLAVSATGAETITEKIELADSTVVSLTAPGVTLLSITAVDVAGNSTTLTHEVSVPEITENPGNESPGTTENTDSSSGGGLFGPLFMLLMMVLLLVKTSRSQKPVHLG